MKQLVVGVLIAAGAVVRAQLPVPALYDEWRRVTLDGVVTRIEWANPRAYVFVDVREAGGVSNWAIEIGNPLDLEQRGWSRTTVRTGDSVSVEAVPARDNAKRALLSTFWTTRPRARVFSGVSATAKASPTVAGPAPRWPDGQVRLGPPAGRKGYWGAASVSTMIETGSKVSVRGDGLLTNLSDADRVAPFQPWAKAVYLHRQRTVLRDDPAARCLPTGGPRQFHTLNGF